MPSVETARLNLRLFRPEDLDDLATLLADVNVMRYVGTGQPVSRGESERALYSIIRHWQEHGFGRWAVIDKATQRFIGFGGLRSLMGTPEVVYHLARPSWGGGLGTELARASLRFGFSEHPFERIVAVAKPENAASLRVMEKVGMQYEKHARYYNLDVIQYQISREDFRCDGGMYRLSSEEVRTL
jgi:ribosomal-protein-alanine N-acetyltransferase